MRVIRANCRVQFTAEDIEFILSALGPRAGTNDVLVSTGWPTPKRATSSWDDEALYRAVLERPHCLRVSTHFYFHLLVRQVCAGPKSRTATSPIMSLKCSPSFRGPAGCARPFKAKPGR